MNLFRTPSFPLDTTTGDIELLFEIVRKSNYVAGNIDYRRKANNTTIFLDDSNIVNAWANSYSETKHEICMYTGICNTSRLMAVALADFKKKNVLGKLIETCQWVGKTAKDNNYRFSTGLIEDGISDLGFEMTDEMAIEAKSYTAGGILSIIAHEQGHICLSHTLRDDWSNEVSRNDERQADLFGCNVSVTTPFSSHIVLATLFEEITFAWMTGDESIATTHPHSRERVYNTLNAHNVILEALGITMNNIDEFLPEK